MRHIAINLLITVLNITATNVSEEKSKETPNRLFELSLKNIKQKFTEEESKILERIYPRIFNHNIAPNYSGMTKLISKNPLYHPVNEDNRILSLIETLDLTELNIEGISLRLCDRLKTIKVLNLSKNPRIRLNQKWIEYFYENLEELNLNDCYLEQDVFNILKNFRKLEKLSLSGTKILNTSSEAFIQVLSKLKYLDVSNCQLNTTDFSNIIKNSKNLESFNFSHNCLASIADIEMRNGSLVISITGNEEIKLPRLQDSSIEFPCKRKNLCDMIFNSNLLMPNMKVLNLENCSVACEEFVKLLFKLPNLETLILSKNHINFDYKGISYNNKLIKLELADCCIDKINSLIEFTDFKNLEVLNVSDNNFLHSTKKFIIGSSKYSLLELNVSNCFIQSETLKEFTKCSNLQIFNFSNNPCAFMSERIDFGNLKETLVDLNILGCHFTAEKLSALTDFSNLQKLNISLNSLENLPINFDCGNLKNTLIELDVIGCKLSKRGINLFTDFPNLQILNAKDNSNEVNQAFALNLGSSKESLTKLILSSCALNENDLKAITGCLKLEELDVSENDFHSLNESFDFRKLNDTLVSLNMADCELSLEGFKSITNFYGLKVLNVSDNLLEIPDDFNFGNLKKTLVKLNLFNCSLISNVFQTLIDFVSLECLDISENVLDGVISEDFDLGNLKDTLVSLKVTNCDVEESFLKVLSKCCKLQMLYYSGNSLENISADFEFGNLSETLILLDASSCKLQLEGFEKLTHFSKLQKLWLSHNNLLGTIPVNFNLGNLRQTLIYLGLEAESINIRFTLNLMEQCSKLKTLDFGGNVDFADLIRDLTHGCAGVPELLANDFDSDEDNISFIED